ncbi:MAG TPA: hypothetical protein VMF59_08970 [Bacteroidota bacterium]|nr:hypothetical protein [Bacteroidota bacterium]
MKRLPLSALALAALLSAFPAFSLPRFASRTGLKCQSCHVDPSGGEMRQTFGVQYGRDQLPVPEWSKGPDMTDFSNVITNILGVGADFRTIYYNRKLTDSTHSDGLFQMQGDLYVNLKVSPKVFLYLNLNKGVSSGFDAYALMNVLPASGHVKIGRFIPDYGTNMDDHTAYVRQYTKLSPEFDVVERTGAEAAVSPGAFTILGGVYNADEGGGIPSTNNKAFLGRGEGMFKLAEMISLGLGGNVFSTKTGIAGVNTTYYGGFGSFSVANFTLLGEADWIRISPSGQTTTALATYAEADYVVTPGVDLKLAYDFYDQDIKFKSGSKSRYSIGVEFFPVSGVEIRPIYRILTQQNPDTGTMSEFDLMLHLYL